MYSLIVPVYRNEENIQDLLHAINDMNGQLDGELELVAVVDGSPDKSFEILSSELEKQKFKSTLISHSRNFGSFIAIKTGLSNATGKYFAVMSADLQEPPELIVQFFKELASNSCDIAIGARGSRQDPLLSRTFSSIFWTIYRRVVDSNVPIGGVDMFGCSSNVCKQIISHNEANSSLIGVLFWLGFRRKIFIYDRRARKLGKSAWTFKRKFKYLMDSLYSFSDLPIGILTSVGAFGMMISCIVGLSVLIARIMNWIVVPGYAAIAIMILFFSTLNLFSLGVLGGYIWRTFENTKKRNYGIVSIMQRYKYAS